MSGGVAWANALQALALFAASPPELGGVAVRAGAGPVRDTWLKLLEEALPAGKPLRRVPLHVRDDRLLGGLDLAATLRAGRPVEQKGLLAEADGGIVVLAMAERLDTGTSARLNAALDDGVVVLQRDGLSSRLPARFGLVALDEGDADERPQASLLDRLAFHVDLTEVSMEDIRDPDLAAAGLDLSLSNPDGGNSRGPPPEADADAKVLCHTAIALGIDSLRAPLLALRVAHAAAAISGRTTIAQNDLELAARLVLAPRATRLPPPEEPEAPQEPEAPPPPEDQTVEQENLPDRPLEDIVLEAAKAALPPDLLAELAMRDSPRGVVRTAGRSGQAKASAKRGRPIGSRQGEPKRGARLHLLETLKAAAPWQNLRRGITGSERFEVRRDDFRIVRFRQRIGTTTIFTVDASGSAAMHRLGEAKGAVELLLADCYVRRDQVALISFRGQRATLLLPPTGSLVRAKRSLSGLQGGGPTPLAAGIEAAVALADTIGRTGRTPVITLLTDARANVARDGSGGRPRAEAEAMESARSLRISGVATLLVDTSPRPSPFARRLADEMRARYVPLPYADASAITRMVRSAAA
jgi:magnesium chelatase subunit D